MKKIFVMCVVLCILTGCTNEQELPVSETVVSLSHEQLEKEELVSDEKEEPELVESETQIVNPEDIGKTFIDGDYEYTISEDGTAMISAYTGTDENLAIPAELGGYPISQIGTESFCRIESIKNIIIPGTIDVIHKDAFKCPNVESIVIEEGVHRIEDKAFYFGAPNLKSISLPNSLDYMGANVFSIDYDKRDEILEEEDGVYYLGTVAYLVREDIDTINFKNDTTGIAGGLTQSMHYVEIDKVSIPEGVKFIGEEAFRGCKVEQYVLPTSLQEIGPRGIGYLYTFADYEKVDIKIYGAEDSYIYNYANDNGFKFVIMK